MFSNQNTRVFAFSYTEDAPAIWGHILNDVGRYFRKEESTHIKYERTLACDLIRAYFGKVNDENNKKREGDRLKDVIYFDDIVNRAYNIAKDREAYIDDKKLTSEQQKSKKLLAELKRIASQFSLTNDYYDKRSLVTKIAEIKPENEFYLEIREKIKELKNELELFNEQAIFLNHNKLIALCVVYVRKEFTEIQLSNTEKIKHIQDRIDYLIKIVIRPVYKIIADTLDFLGKIGLSEDIAESDFKTLLEFASLIYNDVIKNSLNRNIKFTEYPDLHIQSEIEKIVDKEEKLYELTMDRSESTLTRRRIYSRSETDINSSERRIILPPFRFKTEAVDEEEISCFTPILTPLLSGFSCIISPLMSDSEDSSLEDEPLVSTFRI